MKFLIHSNAPSTNTGYGVQCALLARRLQTAGHDVAVSCTFGVQATGRLWEGIPLYPSGWDPQGNDIIHNHALHFFDGDPNAGWIITLTDVWVLDNPLLKDFQVIAWTPVDHFPAPPGVIAFFRRTGAEAVAMSRFGEQMLSDAGLGPDYIPLAVDTSIFKPTPTITHGGKVKTGRELIGVPDDVYLVGMTAMNKDPADRKGFNEAFRAFSAFHREHPDSMLYVHADPNGMGTGLNLREIAVHAGIPEHSVKFCAPYDLQVSAYSAEMMAAVYTAFDVLLAPSKGEGFCVPLIEAQACGTPVIASDFSAQTELVGAGVKVPGQPLWDQSQRASYVIASIPGIIDALEHLHQADQADLAGQAVVFAADYDADLVFERHWRPFLASLEPAPPPELDRTHTIGSDSVAVIVPVMRRPHNVAPLLASLEGSNVSVYFVCDPDDTAEIEAVKAAGLEPLLTDRGHTFAQKVNCAYEHTTEPWLFICGDDVRFHPGWLTAADKLSDRFDVIGTNDSPDGTGNQTVASGQHADHFFIRRSYIDQYGASLDGPGVVCHEGYNHFFVDYEIVGLAKARGVFAPCLASVVEHLHPGLGKGRGDLIYQSPESPKSLEDRDTWKARQPLIAMQQRGRGKAA